VVYVLLLPAKGDKNVSDETPKSIKDVSRLVHLRAHDAPDRDRTRFEKKAVQAYSGDPETSNNPSGIFPPSRPSTVLVQTHSKNETETVRTDFDSGPTHKKKTIKSV
jgi:hypothetical protein